MINRRSSFLMASVTSLAMQGANAVTFETEDIKGSFDSTISAGIGVRAKSPSCGLVLAGNTGKDAPDGCLATTSSLADQGNLNYGRGDLFTGYVKGNHELLLKMPSEVTAMARVNWMRDFAATHTTGIQSVSQPQGGLGSDGLTSDARRDLRYKARLLDLWVSKGFDWGDQHARLRVGNQVVNWGESLFIAGGINATNALDVMRLSQPGVQLKEAVLPAPMISLATGLGGGVNVEGYIQTDWNKNYIPPVGSYWSTSTSIGRGETAYGFTEKNARGRGQWGVAMRWEPQGTSLNLGLYALNYHDKMPVMQIDQATFTPSWVYPEDRKLYGASANFPLGDWSVGTEVSYRPKDAVTLNPTAGCMSRDGRCWVDEKRWQWNLSGMYGLTPGNAQGFLNAIGASAANFMVEGAVVYYPNLKKYYGGDPLASQYWGWGQETDPTASPTVGGSKTSAGVSLDFSVTYDGTLIEGWQVVPEIYYFRALTGRTPNMMGTFMKGASTMNMSVAFIKNPASWQFTVNYARYMGRAPFDQPLKDRDFFGAVASYSF